MVVWLGSINLLVLVFNLVPAFPLDGGRIARAIAWWRTGSRNTGTRFAATLGEWFGLFLILAGLGYFLVYLGDVLGGIWLAFVGFILRGAARVGDRPDRAHQPDRGDLRRRRHGPRTRSRFRKGHRSSRRSTSISCATARPGSPSWTGPST